MYGNDHRGLGAYTAADFETMRPGEWTAQGVDPNQTTDPRDWNPTMSTDPVHIAAVNQMLASGINPVTGNSTRLNSLVLTKGYSWRGAGDIIDAGNFVGNAFDLGAAGVQALPPARRGETPASPDDQTQYGYTPPAPTPSAPPTNQGGLPTSPPSPHPLVAPGPGPLPAEDGGPPAGHLLEAGTPDRAVPFTGTIVDYAPGGQPMMGPGPEGDYFGDIGAAAPPRAVLTEEPSSGGLGTVAKLAIGAAVLYGLVKVFGGSGR